MVKRSFSMSERKVRKIARPVEADQIMADVEASIRNQAIIDSFLLEHPDLDEKAVRVALSKLSNLYPGNSNQSKA